MVAFQAKLTKNQRSLPENAIVIFETTTLNAGYAYSPLTGIFTAPEDGIYFFSWNILAHAGGVFHTEIVYNGKPVAHNHADGRSGSSHYASGSSTAVIGMKRKDQVWIKAMGGEGESAAGDWSSFSGFKL
ncbi:complement C1q tumor necrosis factor-related protein 3-like [Saccostrea cucullata]|uniref:complement C1q tumor necrosis factor-related protein 3-like n=1 Tax=Saccostrea cuccullata TaxID=36930 RepID=UPI002ED320C7